MQKRLFYPFILLAATVLTGCSSAPNPPNSNNICTVFKQEPRWYWDSIDVYNRWGVPVSVQMAIIQKESDFRSDARPPRSKLLGFIPWARPTTAYGYAQAVDDTWEQYKQATGNHDASRDDFTDADNFIGWYAHQAQQQLGISPHNAHDLYLAYWAGLSGYAKGNYRNTPWILGAADYVQSTADRYRNQLMYCYKDIPKPSVWNLWLH